MEHRGVHVERVSGLFYPCTGYGVWKVNKLCTEEIGFVVRSNNSPKYCSRFSISRRNPFGAATYLTLTR